VITAFTFGCAWAALTSMLTILAWATGERRIARCSIPLSWMSST
jgi:hypothetical protein